MNQNEETNIEKKKRISRSVRSEHYMEKKQEQNIFLGQTGEIKRDVKKKTKPLSKK